MAKWRKPNVRYSEKIIEKQNKSFKKLRPQNSRGLYIAGMYMNPATGSVDTSENWLRDYEAAQEEGLITWEEWGGDSLIEVVQKNNQWIEVE